MNRSMNRVVGRGIGWLSLLAAGWVSWAAGDEPPLLLPEDRVDLGRQAGGVFEAAGAATRKAGEGTVWVYADRRQVALGAVIGDGSRVLTKWSEVAIARRGVVVATGDGRAIPATLAGVYEDDDLAVLSLGGEKLRTVAWSGAALPKPGRFMAAALPDGRAGAFGVVGVAARSLRQSDQAFLGVTGDPSGGGAGVVVMGVEPGSGAAAAGVRPGDTILKVGERPVNGVLELRSALLDKKPAQVVELLVSRDGKETTRKVTLGGRPQFAQFPERRLQVMERMGGELSRVRDGFPSVLESDIKLEPNLCGGPVVDLEGQVVGLSAARASRTRSYVIPAARVVELLKQEPAMPGLARAEAPRGEVMPQRRGGRAPADPGAAERMRMRLQEMRRLMETFEREMSEMENR